MDNRSTSASGLPITQLGSTIKAHLTASEKYEGKAEEHYKSAGLHLVEAKARIAAGEYEGKFGMFLMRECNDLSSSRAYELIAIANGTKTVESIRAETNARKRAHREAADVRSGTESTEPETDQPLSSETPHRNPPPKPKGGRPAAPKTPTEVLTQQVT